MLLRISTLTAALCAIFSCSQVARAAQPVPPEGEAVAQSPVVTLLEAGRGELKPLRWEPKVGAAVRAKMTMAMGMSTAIDGNAMPRVDLPAYVFTLVATAGEPDAAGRYPVETLYESVELEGDTDPMLREALLDALEPLEGTTLTFLMDSRGVASETNAGDLPAQILELLGGEQGVRSMVASLSQPLPEEPVGVGARWRIEQVVRAPNAPVINNTLICELVRREGDAVEIRITGTQTGKRQDFDLGVPGAEGSLLHADGTMRGSAYMRLSRLFPIRSNIEGSIDFVMEVTEHGVKQTVEQTVSVRCEVEHLDEDGVAPIDPADAG